MTAYDDSNVFAKILRGELPSHKVYEDDSTIAIMDLMPTADGHTLVIPKAPSRNILDADPGSLTRAIPAVQKIARAVKAAFGADDLTALAERFGAGRLSARDLTRIIGAGLRGAGETISDEDVSRLSAGGGAAGYVRITSALLAATFGADERPLAEAASG